MLYWLFIYIFYVWFFRDCFIIIVNVFGDVMGIGIVEYLLCDDLRLIGDDDVLVVKFFCMSENEVEL